MMIKHDDDDIHPPPSSTSVSIVVHYNLDLDSSHLHLHHFTGDSDLTINLFLDNLDLHIPEPFFYELLTLFATFVYSSLESTAEEVVTPCCQGLETQYAIGTR